MSDEAPNINNSDGSEYTTDDLEEEAQRPNKWQGPPSTWNLLTEQERALAASLDQIRNGDLGLHLFNAHELKRRAREFEENPEEVKKEHPYVPDEDQTFVPPKSWTAWPLPPHRVPREGEHIGPPDPDEQYTFKRREIPRPSRELEDVILGLTLKFAKERFLTRDQEEEELGEQIVTAEENNNDNASLSDDSREEDDDIAAKQSSAPPPEAPLQPVISLDDDRSRAIIRPSIRHTLSKLDDALMALHHSRKTCLTHSDLSATSDVSDMDEERSEPSTPSKRPRGRPRKFSAALPDRSRPQSTPSPEDVDVNDADLLRTKSTHRGRPLRVYERVEGETQQEYLVRIARIQKKPLPAFAPPLEVEPEASPSPSSARSRRCSRPSASLEERAARARKRLRPRDWSEVLSSAALVGFPPDVIARATQRCANLFGEGMHLRTIVETPFMERLPDLATKYVPEEIPDFGEEFYVSSSEENHQESSNNHTHDAQTEDERETSSSSLQFHIPAWQQTCFCPMPECPRRIKGFKHKDALRKHLESGHEIANEEVEDYILPSDEETSGAVHIDGFLKPLKWLGGSRGSYRKVAVKRARVEDSSDENEDEDRDEDEDHVVTSGRQSGSPATTVMREETTHEGSEEDQDTDGDEDDGASLPPR